MRITEEEQRYQQAVGLLHRDLVEEARAELSKLIEERADDFRYRHGLAVALLSGKNQDLKEARKHAERAVRDAEAARYWNVAVLYNTLADAAFRQKDYDTAARYYQQAISACDQEAEKHGREAEWDQSSYWHWWQARKRFYLRFLARVRWQSGDRKQALRDLDIALDHDGLGAGPVMALRETLLDDRSATRGSYVLLDFWSRKWQWSLMAVLLGLVLLSCVLGAAYVALRGLPPWGLLSVAGGSYVVLLTPILKSARLPGGIALETYSLHVESLPKDEPTPQ